jgi:hypothetical protein
MMEKALVSRVELSNDFDGESKLDRAIEILAGKLDISDREAKSRIATLSKMKNLDIDTTCEVIIKLEKIVSEAWFDKATKR